MVFLPYYKEIYKFKRQWFNNLIKVGRHGEDWVGWKALRSSKEIDKSASEIKWQLPIRICQFSSSWRYWNYSFNNVYDLGREQKRQQLPCDLRVHRRQQVIIIWINGGTVGTSGEKKEWWSWGTVKRIFLSIC